MIALGLFIGIPGCKTTLKSLFTTCRDKISYFAFTPTTDVEFVNLMFNFYAIVCLEMNSVFVLLLKSAHGPPCFRVCSQLLFFDVNVHFCNSVQKLSVGP